MKAITWIALIGGGYLAYRLFNKAGAARNLSYSIKGVKYGGSDLSKTWFTIDLGIVNPSNESFSFDKFFGQLRYKGTLLVNVIRDGAGSGIRILPAAETTISLPVYINHLSTLIAAKEILEKLTSKQNIEGLALQGMLYAGGLSVPVEQNLNIQFSKPAVSGTADCFTCNQVSGVLN